MGIESINGKKMNKGEWAELYVLLKILGDGKLYTADNLLRKNCSNYLDIIKVFRQELDTMPIDYSVSKDEKTIQIESNNEVLAEIPMADFSANAVDLFDGIKDLRGNSVPAPDSVCDFARIIYVSKPKAPAVKSLKQMYGGKNDIFVKTHDGQTGIESIMGFSIKSKFGQNPTLFNAGSSSQFLYKVDNCNDDLMNEFNDISEGQNRGWNQCKNFLKTHNMKLSFAKTQNLIYESNMLLVRESMSKIMAWCVEDRLINAESDFEVKETVERMALENPCKVQNPDIYYEKAMKDFLMAGFTGMTAGKPWDGREQVNGGYIVVMEDGDVLCYHSSDREAFRDYLYRNTHFEYVSAKKYNWSKINKENGDYFLSLNISIRFNTHTR
ncbi:MAG: HpaII family restriction endonuclease [Lachnospiraceae bacterium]|nr:HpaII family restriction endonuclease [Lachnospiraceae bacterium]